MNGTPCEMECTFQLGDVTDNGPGDSLDNTASGKTIFLALMSCVLQKNVLAAGVKQNVRAKSRIIKEASVKTISIFMKFVIAICLCIGLWPASGLIASGQTGFYVAPGGNDNNPGTKENPWKTLQRVSEADLAAGDTVYFARGGRYGGGLLIKSSGTSAQSIVLTAYGIGKAPRLTNNDYQRINGNIIQIQGSHIIVDGLYFRDSLPANRTEGVSARLSGAIFINRGADHNIIRNSEFENCPMAIQVYGEHCLITQNYIHDCNMFLAYPGWGPVGIMVATSHNEISYNRIENYVAIGGAFEADGGAIEIDDSNIPKENIFVHHNYSVGNEGFLEIIDGDIKNVRVSHNISDDFQEFIFFWGGKDCLVENNTVLCTRPSNSRVRVVFSFAHANEVMVRNNIFVVANGLQVFAGDSVYSADKYDQPRENNIYFSLDGSQKNPCGKLLGKGEIIADPLFVNLKGGNYHLQPGSPAVDAGVLPKTLLDFDNSPIPFGKAPDIGAYEYAGKLLQGM